MKAILVQHGVQRALDDYYTMLDVIVLEHIYVPIIVSSLIILHWFYTYSPRFYLVLVSKVF